MTAEIREALVVGINRYPFWKDKPTSKARHLLKPAADAESIAKVLENYGNFKVRRLPAINIDGSWQLDSSANGLVKMQDLKKAIGNLFNPPSKSIPDTALLFFAGHGLRSDEGGVTEGFLATSEANPLRGKWGLSMHWLRQLLQESPVRHQIVWLDCCHSGELLNFEEVDPGSRGKSKVRNRCLIAASRDFELADEEVGGEHGVLTGALLEALDPKNYAEGYITNYTLTEFIKQQLQISRQIPIIHNIGSEIILTGDKEKIDRVLLQKQLCPYKGLESFNDEDGRYFKGRTELTDVLLNKVKQSNFVAVLGDSGSGKSSLVKAGLIYHLRIGQKLGGSENWPILIFRPGKTPLENLAAVFSDTEIELDAVKLVELVKNKLAEKSTVDSEFIPSRLVLVADQFEECFTLSEEEDRQNFFECVLGALDISDNQLCLIINMRADFFGKCAEREYAGLSRLIQDNLITVTPMNREELEQAITEPAQMVGLTIEPELVKQMLDDVENSPGSLPLLQYTLKELWKERKYDRLTSAAYNELGGVKGTLQKQADRVYEQLKTEEEKITAQRIFLELTHLGEGIEDTRQQILKSDLINEKCSDKLVEDVLNKLAEARLVVISELVTRGRENQTKTSVDVAHEALIRNWPLLREWVNKHRDAIRIERKIEASAKEWESKGKPKDNSFLLSGQKLLEAEEYLKYYYDLGLFSRLGEEFIQKSQGARELIEQEEKNRQQRENALLEDKLKEKQKSLIILRRSAVVLAGLILLLAGFGIFAFFQRQEAENRKENAQILLKTLSAKDKFFSSNLELEGLIDALKAGQKLKQQNKPQTDTKMQVVTTLEQIYYQIAEYNRSIEHTTDVNSVSISPDGKIVASGSADKTIKLWSIPEGKKIATLSEHGGAVNSVSFSPDGKTLASASSDQTIKIWNIAENKVIFTLQGHSGEVKNVSFSPDGKTIASASSDRNIKIWDIATGKVIVSLLGHNDAVNSVSFSPDGKTLASASSDQTIKIWDIATGKEIATLSGHSGAVNTVSFSPDGKTLASGSSDSTIKIWDIAKKIVISTIPAHQEGVLSLTWSWDGKTMASSSDDNTIKLWKVPEGKEIATLKGHNNWVNSVSISPDGKTLVSGSSDSTIKLWNISQDKQIPTLKGHKDAVNSVSVSPNGKTLASGSYDGTIKLWNILEAKEITTLKGHNDRVSSVAWSPDGKILASGSHDKTIKLWSFPEGKEIITLKGHNGAVSSVSFSPDGKTIASGSFDKTTKLWDIATGKELINLQGHDGGVTSVAWRSDGKMLASASLDNTIVLWNMPEGNKIYTVQEGSKGLSSLAWSPDGKILAVGTGNNTIVLWNIPVWNKNATNMPEPNKIATLKGHNKTVNSIAWSPDGKILASGSSDKTIAFWHIPAENKPEGTKINSLEGHTGDVNSVAWSPDGKTLVSGSVDSTVILWNLDLDQLLAEGCLWVGDYLKNPQAELNELERDKRQVCDRIGTLQEKK